MRASALLALALLGCSTRALDAASPDLHVATLDLAAPLDLATPVDLAAPHDFAGPKRHLFEPCDFDEECLSGDCLFAGETRGEFDHVCGQGCGVVGQPALDTTCLEGTCLTFDLDVFWCLPTCVPTNQNADCPPGLVCCSGGDVNACVSSAPLACEPRPE